jgi:hypothetical protein
LTKIKEKRKVIKMSKKIKSLSSLNRSLGQKGYNLENYLGKEIDKEAAQAWFEYGNYAEWTNSGCLVFVENGTELSGTPYTFSVIR